ncbi:hypothetical protein GRX01_09420 [Halobaculum sp. WSA2]|uniref:DUF7311 domain-containing protein n=1 Tax=Halobaculum saliterrae TaxID=2073113 RepID=A0A6B0SSC7_9EURY|nr:hypothetical protein [Halobaculum saliterrae]
MIRVVVAVAVAAALLSASLPAVETARVDRTTAAVERVPDRIDRAARSALAGEPERRSSLGSAPTARRVVSVAVPGESIGTAPVRSLSLCPGAERGTAVLIHAVGDAAHSRTTLSAPYDLPNGGIALDRSRRVFLSLVPVSAGSDADERRIRVRLLDRSSAGAGSSSETGPPRPCDSSTTSVTASATGGAPTSGPPSGAVVAATPSSTAVLVPGTGRVPGTDRLPAAPG